MPEVTFKWRDGTITVDGYKTPAKQFKQVRTFKLIDLDAIEEPIERHYVRSALVYLNHTVRTEGDVGFFLPYENPTQEDAQRFLDEVFQQDESLFDLWDAKMIETRGYMHDPDLLPPNIATPHDDDPDDTEEEKAKKK